MKSLVFFYSLFLLSVGCGKRIDDNGQNLPVWNRVVRSRVEVEVNTTTGDPKMTEVDDRASTMTLDKSQFVTPVITNAVVNFGYLRVATLSDTSLRVCGPNKNRKCVKAMLSVYTTGAGAGFYNAVDKFSAPITSTLTTPISAGLGAANAALMQTIRIPANKNSVTLADFTPAPKYNIKGDFTDAGSGSYGTTIVVEYSLSL